MNITTFPKKYISSSSEQVRTFLAIVFSSMVIVVDHLASLFSAWLAFAPVTDTGEEAAGTGLTPSFSSLLTDPSACKSQKQLKGGAEAVLPDGLDQRLF